MLVLLLHHVGTPPPGVEKGRKLWITAEQLNGHVRWLKDGGYLDAAQAALDVPATIFVITSRVGERRVVLDEGLPPADLASWDELKALRDRGWEIGSHAHRHTRRPGYEDLAES